MHCAHAAALVMKEEGERDMVITTEDTMVVMVEMEILMHSSLELSLVQLLVEMEATGVATVAISVGMEVILGVMVVALVVISVGIEIIIIFMILIIFFHFSFSMIIFK